MPDVSYQSLRLDELTVPILDRLWDLRLERPGRSDMTRFLEQVRNQGPRQLAADGFLCSIVVLIIGEVIRGWSLVDVFDNKVFINVFVAHKFRNCGYGTELLHQSEIGLIKICNTVNSVPFVDDAAHGFYSKALPNLDVRQAGTTLASRPKRKPPAPLPAPIPMRLFCEACHRLHVDEGKFATHPHKTHQCKYCGLTWRPANVPTVGVMYLHPEVVPVAVPAQKIEMPPMTAAAQDTKAMGFPSGACKVVPCETCKWPMYADSKSEGPYVHAPGDCTSVGSYA